MPVEEQKIIEDKKYQSTNETSSVPLDQEAIKKFVGEEVSKLKQEITKQEDGLKESKRDLVTVLGLFATFLTFTTVEFQLIKSLNGLTDFISLSLLMISLAVILAIVIKHDFSNKNEDLFQNKGLWLGLGLLILSIVFFCISITINNHKINNPSYNFQMFSN